jgi:RND superfamily putative drug exporter
LPAIVAAAGINILGLFMLTFATFGIFRTTGPAVAVALCVALAAAVTLLPACVGALGGRLFWPTRITPGRPPSRPWTWLAGVVTRRPGAVLGLTLLALAVPAGLGVRQEWAYDTLEALRAREVEGVGNSARGAEIAKRHWPIGELAPVEVLIQTSTPLTPAQWNDLTLAVRDSLWTLPLPESRRGAATTEPPTQAIVDIRSLSDPLGLGQTLPRLGKTPGPLSEVLATGLIPGSKQLARIDADIQKNYISPDRRATFMELVLATGPFTGQALSTVGDIQRQTLKAAQDALRKLGVSGDVQVFLMGPTAEMAATRDVTQRDFHVVAGLVLGVIFVMILALLRDAVLALWMLGSTVLSYFATLGLCWVVFVAFGSFTGLDWKLEIFLFVVMVAVGQDYNIFLATRLVQERAVAPDVRTAARRAMTFTGPVISSCGLIMAATLGSLVVGELALLVQLGFAMALGMLIDTFLVRPLLLPAFCCLTGRTGKPSRWVH